MGDYRTFLKLHLTQKMFIKKMMLTLSGFRTELRKMEERGLVCPCLAEAIIFLVERKSSRRDHPITDLPELNCGIRKSIEDYTDDGRLLIDGKPFQLCALKAPRFRGRSPRLTLVEIIDPSYRICSL